MTIKPLPATVITAGLLLLMLFLGLWWKGGLFRRERILVVAPAEELFSPDAEYWSIPFALVSTAGWGAVPPVALRSVAINGAPLERRSVTFLEHRPLGLPVVPAGRYLPPNRLSSGTSCAAGRKKAGPFPLPGSQPLTMTYRPGPG